MGLAPGRGEALLNRDRGPGSPQDFRRGVPPPRSRPSRNDSMTISPPERGSTAKTQVEKVDNPATFELFGKPGHFDRALAKGPKTTTWVWNLHANAHDFDSHTSDLEEVSRKIFSAHFGHLAERCLFPRRPLLQLFRLARRSHPCEAKCSGGLADFWPGNPQRRHGCRFPGHPDHLRSLPCLEGLGDHQ